MKMITKILNKLKKKKPQRFYIGRCGIVDVTDYGKFSGVHDSFSRVIRIYDHIELDGNHITYGKILEEIPFSQEDIKALKQVKDIPIVIKKYGMRDLDRGISFGEVING